MLFSALLSILTTSVATLAAPAGPLGNAPSGLKLTGCPIANAKPNVPSSQAAVTIPSGSPVYIALGVGVQVRVPIYSSQEFSLTDIMQNYTCGSTGTFTSAGAVAKLFDVSCLVNTPLFSGIQDMVFSVAGNAKGQALVSKIGGISIFYL
jgi:hypothetical protein